TARRMADGSLLRLEAGQKAIGQGKSAASALLGRARRVTAAPWVLVEQKDRGPPMGGPSGRPPKIVGAGTTAGPRLFAPLFPRRKFDGGGLDHPRARPHGGAQAARPRALADVRAGGR